MSNDEAFDRWVADAAAEYHRPPAEVPREAMWQAIRDGLAVERASATGPVAEVPRIPVARSWGRHLIPMLAAAAVLVVVAYRLGVSTGTRQGTAALAEAPGDTPAYDVATRALFDRAELLFATTRESLGESAADSATTRWAREMLSETRLLLDSPAATPPGRRALLEDLELLLAQIVRLPAAGTPDDRTLMDRSLRGDLLTRFRTTMPASVRGT